MAAIHLIEGPVGAGKSTYSALLAKKLDGIHIPLDAWFAKLYSPDRPEANIFPWYKERKDRLIDHIWQHSKTILASGTDVILELGLIQRQNRADFYQRFQNESFELVVYVLDAPREVRWQRVQRRNTEQGSTFSMNVPDHIFKIASDMWETPDEDEISSYKIKFVETTA